MPTSPMLASTPGSFAAPPAIRRIGRLALFVGLIATLACCVGALFQPAQFFHSYLIGYIFVFGLGGGCLALLMLQYLTGGRWGLAVRRMLEAGSRTLPVIGLMFLPVVGGMHSLYRWTHGDIVAKSQELVHKRMYLNLPFFLCRAIAYFLILMGLAYFLNRWSRQQDLRGPDDFAILRRLRILSGPGLVLYGLTLTFAGIDWLMSLAPEWFSTIYGMTVIVGQGLSAVAFVIALSAVLVKSPPMAAVLTPDRFHDLGKLLLMFVMLWAYLAFSQFLIIWAGNLTDEIPWYLYRFRGGWIWVGIVLIACHFALPFLLLLSRDLKRHSHLLLGVAAFLLLMRLVDLFWLTEPEFHHGQFHLSWMDLLAPIGLGGIWLAMFCWQLGRWPLLPPRDPYLAFVLPAQRGGA